MARKLIGRLARRSASRLPLLFGWAVLSLAGCSTAPPPTAHISFPPSPMEAKQTFPLAGSGGPADLSPATPALSDAAIKAQADAWFECAVTKARELDDDRSDAATIAEGVRSACRRLYLLSDNDDRRYAIGVVLQLRANAAKKTQKLDPEFRAAAEKWATCVYGGILKEDDGKADVAVLAETIRRVCAYLHPGAPGTDGPLIVKAMQENRARASSGSQIPSPPPQKMAPPELRM